MFLIEVYLDMMRIALFIDGIHFYRSFGQSQHEIDYDALAKWVVNKITPNNAVFVGGYYYTYDLEQASLQRFLTGLSNRTGFFVQKYPYIRQMVNRVIGTIPH